MLVLVLIVVQIYLGQQSRLNNKSLPPVSESEMRVFFDFGNDERRIFDGAVIERMSVFDALKQSAKAGQFNFEYIFEREKVFIGAINGFSNQKNAVWKFYLNGKEISEDLLGVQKTRAGDIVEAHYILD